MQRVFGVVRDGGGNALATVSVAVNLVGTATPATIYSDNAYSVLANPFFNSNDGTYQFYVANGRYDVVLTKTGFGYPVNETADIVVEDEATIITPTALAGNVNDYAPTNGLAAATWRVSATIPANITGILAPLPTQRAYRITIFNIGPSTITFQHNNAGSVVTNRLLNKTGADVAIITNSSIVYVYDTITLQWRQVA